MKAFVVFFCFVALTFCAITNSLAKDNKANKNELKKLEELEKLTPEIKGEPVSVYFLNSYNNSYITSKKKEKDGDDSEDSDSSDDEAPDQTSSEKEVVDVDPGDEETDNTYSVNEDIILQTADGKYVLIDVATKNKGIRKLIVDKLRKLQNTPEGEVPFVDYLILTHIHPDHVGNAVPFFESNEMRVRHLIIKKVNYKKKSYKAIINAAKNAAKNGRQLGLQITEVSEEHDELQIGKFLTLVFFNVKDNFADKSCGYKYTSIKFSNPGVNFDKSKAFKGYKINVEGKKKTKTYVYFDAGEYFRNKGSKVTLKTVSDVDKLNSLNPTQKLKASAVPGGFRSNVGIYKYYFARVSKNRKNCSANVNSYGILAAVKYNENDVKYIYFGNDIENGGYSIFSTNKNKDKPKVDGIEFAPIFGSGGFSRAYEYKNDPNSKKKKSRAVKTLITFDEKNKEFTHLSENNYLVPAETITAHRIRDYIVSKNHQLSQLVLYQASHHGVNVAPDAAEVLKLNENKVRTIFSKSKFNPNSFNQARSFGWALKDVKASFVGKKADKGIKCSISTAGTLACKRDFEGKAN